MALLSLLPQYLQMPNLVELDDYNRCLGAEGSDGAIPTYCMTRALIKPDNSSKLRRLIEEFSKDTKRHFNHTLLDRGLCIEDCRKLVESLPLSTREQLIVESPVTRLAPFIGSDVSKATVHDRERFAELANICLNYRLNKTNQLMAYTEVVMCDRSSDTISVGKSVYVSFSLVRNWYRLTTRSQQPLAKDLRFLNAFRFTSMYVVIVGHALLLSMLTPINNTYLFEEMYHQVSFSIISGGTRVTQTFLTMSGLLLAIAVTREAEKQNGSLQCMPW
ncbi:uncharacterized protein LOC129752459 [Uranotaenia lowii]|uniref:uncharacterized protein LOC129752459 n=1 Tax=Uranotaenia lowii TaxID=190385 RepID=UPI002479269B|nr:uncharacterized protein LOC129752459 [Uranotaenia lowii]